MTVRRLLNANALGALVLGLVLLLNGLLGPRFPFGSAIAAVLGILLLVAAMFLGQGGMGKGPLTARIRTVGCANLCAAVVLLIYALLGLDEAALGFVLVVVVVMSTIGFAQLRPPPRADGEAVASVGHRRATAEELRAAIGRLPSDPTQPGETPPG